MDDTLEFLKQSGESPDERHYCIIQVSFERCVRPSYYFSIKSPTVQLCIDHANEFTDGFMRNFRRVTDHFACVCYREISTKNGTVRCACEADYMWKASAAGSWSFGCESCMSSLKRLRDNNLCLRGMEIYMEIYKFR